MPTPLRQATHEGDIHPAWMLLQSLATSVPSFAKWAARLRRSLRQKASLSGSRQSPNCSTALPKSAWMSTWVLAYRLNAALGRLS